MEIGDGSSEPFEYETITDNDWGFNYNISAKVGNKKIPISLRGDIYDWWEFKNSLPEQDIINMVEKFNLPLPATDINAYEPNIHVNKNFNSAYIVFGLASPKTLKGIEALKANKRKGVYSSGGLYPVINDKTYMFRLMATIKQILIPLIEKHKINIIFYDPAKRDKEKTSTSTDTGRSKLYSIFIRNSFPNTKNLNSSSKIRPYVYTLIRPIK